MASVLFNLVDWLKNWYYDKSFIDLNKQDKLESGVNIKTINNETILGSGNLVIQGGSGGGSAIACVSEMGVDDTDDTDVLLYLDACDNLIVTYATGWSETTSDSKVPSEKLVKSSLDGKQATLVSGTNIKTINNESLLGSGNITIQGGSGSVIGTGSFSINSSGHLVVELPNAVDNPYFIGNDGHLYYDTTNTHNGS